MDALKGAVIGTGHGLVIAPLGFFARHPDLRAERAVRADFAKPEPGALTSIAFGGKDSSYLYVIVNCNLFGRPTKRTGVTLWAPVKPPRPAL